MTTSVVFSGSHTGSLSPPQTLRVCCNLNSRTMLISYQPTVASRAGKVAAGGPAADALVKVA